MRKFFLFMSLAIVLSAMTACNSGSSQERKAMNDPLKQEREFIDQAIKQRSPDVMKVEVIDSTVLFTHIYDGIVDIKAYTFDGDVCVEAERLYTFPTQMSALRHYRNAVEKAELYDNIEMFNNQVKYDLKKQQHELETKGLTKEQLKAKFDKQIAEADAEIAKVKHGMKDHHRGAKKPECCR